MTITSSHPAVLEALNRHDAKMDRTRSRDDMDMERILKPRDAPDVVRSTYGQIESEFRTNAFDNLFGAPEKISIPERYIPEQVQHSNEVTFLSDTNIFRQMKNLQRRKERD